MFVVSCTSESKNNIDVVSCIIDYNLWLHYGMTWFIHKFKSYSGIIIIINFCFVAGNDL